ncbi:hypothetical protein COCNU_scaffold011788G000010 [Cocos nucifera]|nr:hypothetical protein [Cocos nucifera]
MRIRVRGGGKTSQIYAIRQSIANAVLAFYQKHVDEQSKKEIRDILVRYDRTLLVADPHRCEPKKFSGRGARTRFQKSYRLQCSFAVYDVFEMSLFICYIIKMSLSLKMDKAFLILLFGSGSEPGLVEATTAKLKKWPFYHSFWNHTTKPPLDLAKELLETFTARKMGKVFFTNSGSEANDSQQTTAAEVHETSRKSDELLVEVKVSTPIFIHCKIDYAR